MKFKNLAFSAIAALMLTACGGHEGDDAKIGEAETPAAQMGTTTYTVDTSASEVMWLAKKVTGQHNGTVQIESGMLGVENGKLQSGQFTMNMKSIYVQDLEGNAENQGKLTGHLNSPDFFNTDSFPTATFVITEAKMKDGAGAANYDITGNLTIKGITKSITFPAMVEMQGEMATATADFNIDRREWNIRYGSKTFFPSIGDKAIYDDFNIKLKLSARPAQS